MKKLIGRKKTDLISNAGVVVMLGAVFLITTVNFTDGPIAKLITLSALGICLFLMGMFLALIALIYRKYAQTVKEIRMATRWNVDCLTDEIRECHNLDDNQA